MYMYMYVYMIKRDNKQSNTIQYNTTTPETTLFSKEKWAASGGIRTHDTLLSRPSALPLSYRGNSIHVRYAKAYTWISLNIYYLLNLI